MHTHRKLILALFALLALTAIVAGCGGGGSSSSGSTTATTSSGDSSSSSEESGSGDESSSGDSGGTAPAKAAFIKEADQICSAGDAAMSEEITDYAKENNIPLEEKEPSEDQEVELFHAVVLPNIGKQAEEIGALTPPEGEEETVEDIVDTLTSEIEEAEEADGIPGESTLEGASKKAKAYGLKSCGS